MILTIDIEDGGPAFKNVSLRDYFAAAAIQGMLANPEMTVQIRAKTFDFWLQETAWQIADGVLHTRSAHHKLFSYPVTELSIDKRLVNALRLANIKTIGELCNQHLFSLKRMPNIGKVGLKKLINALAEHNLKVKGD